jgi:TonB-dependent starch-binding outer membrane protein SusC
MKKKRYWGYNSGFLLPLKFLRVMKISILLTCILSVNVMASVYSQNSRFDLQIEDMSVRDILRTIENESKFRFFYNDEFTDLDKKLTFSISNKSIDDIMSIILNNSDVIYKVLDNNFIVITPKSLFQVRKITGTVTDAGTGNPLPGVTVLVEGTTKGVITDIKGNYSLDILDKDVALIFSFIGYNSQTVPIVGRSIINISMEVNIQTLDEVVVIGYGSVKKSDLTGSVSSITKQDIGDRVVTTVGAMIQGKVAGVDVTQNQIRIRGVTTLNSTDPLIVIDGFLGGDMSTVNPDDIEGIEVLKDASSTAIYGARGANGVILVNTKNGKAGPLKVNINTYGGYASPAKKLNLLNASQYVDYVQEALTNANLTITDRLRSADVRIDRTNWQNEVLRTSPVAEVDANLSGGSEKSTFFVSLGYNHHEAVYIGPSSDQANIRIKNQFNVKKWLKTGDNISLGYGHSEGAEPRYTLPYYTSLPYLPVYDPNNYWGYGIVDIQNDLSNSQNVVAYSKLRHPLTNTVSYQANLWADIEPFKGLIYHFQAGVTGSSARFNQWNDQFQDASKTTVPADLTKTYTYNIVPLAESYLTYSHKFGKHDLTAMVGNTWQNYSSSGGIGIYGQGYDQSTVQTILLAKSSAINYEANSVYAYLSYFGRLNYQFNSRYLLTFNVRYDGSPRFAPSNRWGTFPSVALAWKLSEENFIKNLKFFDLLKLRGSWGISGNDAIGDFRYLSQVWTNGVFYPLGTVVTLEQGASVVNDASNNIKWESTISKTVGLDMAFLKNSFTVTADYFVKNTNDILFAVPRASSLGYGTIGPGDAIINAASCINKGIELQLSYKNSIGAFNYFINANYTNINNKVTSLGLGQPYLAGSGYSRTAVGYPIGYLYGFIAQGVFMTQASVDAANQSARDAALSVNPQLTADDLAKIYYQYSNTSAGDMKFKDLNGDGKITDADRTMIGNSIPKHIYGFSLDVEYKGFDLNATFQGIAGSDLFLGRYALLRGESAPLNQESYILNRWKSEAEPGNGMVPRAVIGDPTGNNRPSTLMVFSGDYLKLKQLSIGYSLPQRLSSKMGFSKLRIYISGNNLFCLTKYPYFDPEVQTDNLSRAEDSNFYPTARITTLGFQIGF